MSISSRPQAPGDTQSSTHAHSHYLTEANHMQPGNLLDVDLEPPPSPGSMPQYGEREMTALRDERDAVLKELNDMREEKDALIEKVG